MKTLKLTGQQFFSKGEKVKTMHTLIKKCFEFKLSLRIEFNDQQSNILIDTHNEADHAVILEATPSIPSITRADTESVKQKLILPLLFRLNKISIPHEQIISVRSKSGSPADYIARILFISALRRTLTKTNYSEYTDGSTTLSRQFIFAYLHVIKDYLNEPIFDNHSPEESLEIILNNYCLESKFLKHELLNWSRKDPNKRTERSNLAKTKQNINLNLQKARAQAIKHNWIN